MIMTLKIMEIADEEDDNRKDVELPGQKFKVALLTLFSGRVESLLHE